jgi:hypothetical protein
VLRYELDGTFVDEFTDIGVPRSIGIDWDAGGNLYISSFGSGTVTSFDTSGNSTGIFVDNSELSGPTNIYFDDDGNLQVFDWNDGDVEQYDSTGAYIDTFITDVSQVEGVDFLPNGNIILGHGNDSSVKEYLPDGTFVGELISSGLGGLDQPNAVILFDRSTLGLEENEKVVEDVAVALGETLRKSLELALDSVQLLTEGIIALTETKQAIDEFLPFGLKIQDVFLGKGLPTFITRLDDTTISISETTEQLRLFRDADMESRIELEKFNEEMAKANSGFKEFAENAKDTHSIEPFVVVPVENDEEDIFTQLQRIREKTGVGLMLQIKRQFRLELDVLKEAREQGLLSEEEFLLQRERLNTLFEERITKAKKDELSKRVILEKQAQSQILDATGDALQKLSGINKTAFRAYQAFQIAMATVNTFRAVSNALQQFPFPLNLAVAAGEAARGFATVAAIRATAPPRIAGGRVNEGQPYMVGEGGKPELFVPQSSGTIVPNNQLTGTNVNITIMANDTEGFDDLLESRRATVVNIINDALNSQGKEAII